MSEPKPIIWMGSSRKDLREFPEEVRREIGQALNIAQFGGQSGNVKILKGFSGGSVLEVIEDFHTDTYRAVYTVRFAQAIIVLHSFQKKSKRGSEMPQHDKQLIRHRLRDAQNAYQEWLETQED